MAIQGSGLYGPTLFAPCLKTVVEYIKSLQHEPIYHVYLILTDGAIHDLEPTIDLLVEASRLPLSVIIVGVGNENFFQMEVLDGDSAALRSSSG